MTTAETKRLLMDGATIEKGAFSGHWLRTRDGKRSRLTATQARELLPICARIDDGKSRCGATWALCDCQDADNGLCSNACLVHNDNPVFWEN